MIFCVAFDKICIKPEKCSKTKIRLYMHPTVSTTNISPFLNLLSVNQTERFNNVIDIVPTANYIKFSYTGV